MSRPIEDRLVAGDPDPLHVEPDDEVLEALVRRARLDGTLACLALVGILVCLILVARHGG